MIKITSIVKRLLNEGMTITVSGAGSEYPELDTVLHIIFAIQHKALLPLEQMTPEEKEEFKKYHAMEILAPDGNDFDKPTGVISFYLGGIPHRLIKPVLESIREQCDMLSIKLGHMTVEHSKMFIIAGTKTPMPVIRIPIIENNNKYNGPPEFHISYSSYEILFNQILGFHNLDPYCFTLPVDEVERRVAEWLNLSDEEMMQKLGLYTQPTSVEKGGGMATMIMGGYDHDRLYRMLNDLNELVKWAKSHGYTNISGS